MPEPYLIEVAIDAKAKADRDRLRSALDRFAAEDPSFGVQHDAESGQTIIKGPSEHGLDQKIELLCETCGIAVAVGAPQVAYRETLARRVVIDETYIRHEGGRQFAKVKFLLEPNAAGAGSSFKSMIAGGAVPAEYVPRVEKSILSAMGCGVLAGFPVVDVKVTLIDGAFHDTDSSALAFEIAAKAAFRRAFKEGGAILLEPIMKVEIATPEDYTGFVLGDLSARRARVTSQKMRADAVVIDALVPLANLFGYVNQLRSGTEGRARFTMQFDHYEPAPRSPDDDGPCAPAVALRV